ncbi:protease inhibitor I42 family protein [Patescibacteria group bacterium]
MKKFLIILGVFILIGGGIYWLSIQTINEPIFIEDDILSTLEAIEEETQIDFSDIAPVELGWYIKGEQEIEKIIISGKEFKAKEISEQQYEKVELFFEDNGFEIDVYNVADGTVAGLAGYKKGQEVCAVASGFTGYREASGQWIPTIIDKYDIEIKCGEIDESIIPIASEDDLIDVKTIEVDNGENFLINLESNITTGYQWEGEYDENYIQFISKEYVKSLPELIGSGGIEVFNFLALQNGDTEIVFSYLRSWEGEAIKKIIYNIVIK